jgi:hypothetical protein
MKEMKVAGAGLVIVGCEYLLEKAGVFLYVGYTVARSGAIVAAVVMVALAIIVSRGERRAPVVLGILIAMLIGASGWYLESVRSSPRKEFYLAAIRIKTGMTEHDARSIMAPYRLFVVADGEESFRFRSSLDTEDALIIRYDPATKKIISTELSLD